MNKTICPILVSGLLLLTIAPQAYSQTQTIGTPFNGNSLIPSPQSMFLDVVNIGVNPVQVDGTFRFNFQGAAGPPATINGYYRPGTWVGNQNSPVGWTQFGSALVAHQGNNVPSPANLGGGFIIPVGQTYGLLFSSSSSRFYMVAGGGVGNVIADDGVLQLLAGGTGRFILGPGRTFQTQMSGELDYTIILPTTATPAAPAFHRAQPTPTFFVADTLAIDSVMYSALPFGQAQLGAFRQAINTIGPGINARIFRARAGENNLPPDTLNPGLNASNGSSLLRYLDFVSDENMSYKVALGLAEPEERTVEVNMVDTLSSQRGQNLNGQSLSGGLPYAMMGVPLMPMAGGAATVKIIEAAPSGKTVIDDSKAVIENEAWNRWELFVAGDFSFYDQDQLTDLMQGFDTNTYAGSVGLEYRALDWLNLGLAWSYLESDTHISGNLGDIDLEGNLISGYATAFWRQYWADILYTYGTFNNDLRRNTGFGSSARGDTDSDSHNIRLNFGRNFNIGSDVVTGPIAAVRYSMGGIDPYSETGGGTAAVDYDGTDFESMISRLGWQATHFRSTSWGRLVSQAHLAWEHEYMPENGTVGASLQTSPFALVTGSSARRVGGFSAKDNGAHPGTDWLSAGVGLRFELSNGVSVNADYEGVFFRSNAAQHYASAKVSYEW